MKKTILAFMMSLAFAACMTSCVGETDIPAYDNPWKDNVGNGTVESPFNCKAAVTKCKEIGSVASSEWYFVTGYITSIIEVNIDRGNFTFMMADEPDGEGIFEAYRLKSFDMAKFTSEDALKVGDKITLFAPLTYFSGKVAETNEGMLYELNGEIGGKVIEPEDTSLPTLPEGDGSEEKPYNVEQIINFAKAAGNTTTEPVYFTGYVTLLVELSTYFGNATFYVANRKGGRTMFYVYQVYDEDGKNFTDENKIQEGDLVVIKSPVTCFNGKVPETVQKKGQLVSVSR